MEMVQEVAHNTDTSKRVDIVEEVEPHSDDDEDVIVMQ
jgi:hypothetical protein